MREHRFVAWSLGGAGGRGSRARPVGVPAAARAVDRRCPPRSTGPTPTLVTASARSPRAVTTARCGPRSTRPTRPIAAWTSTCPGQDLRPDVDRRLAGRGASRSACHRPSRSGCTQRDGATIDAGGASSALVVESGSLGMGGLSATGAASSGIRVAGGSLVVFGASFTGNQSAGIQVDAAGSARLSYVQLDDNGSSGAVSNGSLDLDHVSASRNTTGVEVDAGQATISDSVISGNTGGMVGGGIDAGGIFGTDDVTMLVRRTLIDHNQAESGGGIYYHRGTLTLEDSTITANTGGGLQVGASYPTIYSAADRARPAQHDRRQRRSVHAVALARGRRPDDRWLGDRRHRARRVRERSPRSATTSMAPEPAASPPPAISPGWRPCCSPWVSTEA